MRYNDHLQIYIYGIDNMPNERSHHLIIRIFIENHTNTREPLASTQVYLHNLCFYFFLFEAIEFFFGVSLRP